MELSYRSTGEEVVLFQRALNEKLGKRMTADGQFGKITEENCRAYQRVNKLPITGVYDKPTQSLLAPFINNKYIRYSDIDKASKVAKLPTDIIKTIRKIEARSNGFLPDGRTVILFERHKFYSELVTRIGKVKADEIAKHNPSICSPLRGGYLGNEQEYTRLNRGIQIHKEATLLSASYGLFQIMGQNFKMCGYSNVETFVNAMQLSEHNQLSAVLAFINSYTNLKKAIIQRDVMNIARFYNGPAHATNDYAAKFNAALLSYKA